jgi:hypothetical protein
MIAKILIPVMMPLKITSEKKGLSPLDKIIKNRDLTFILFEPGIVSIPVPLRGLIQR